MRVNIFKLSAYQKQELQKLDFFSQVPRKFFEGRAGINRFDIIDGYLVPSNTSDEDFCPFEMIEWVFSDCLDVKSTSIARTKEIVQQIKLLKDIESKARALTKSFGHGQLAESLKEKIEYEYWQFVGVKDPFFTFQMGRKNPSLEIEKIIKAISNVREDIEDFKHSNHRQLVRATIRSWQWLFKDTPIEINYKSSFFSFYCLLIDEKGDSEKSTLIKRLRDNLDLFPSQITN